LTPLPGRVPLYLVSFPGGCSLVGPEKADCHWRGEPLAHEICAASAFSCRGFTTISQAYTFSSAYLGYTIGGPLLGGQVIPGLAASPAAI
jgi:hypothetical protein